MRVRSSPSCPDVVEKCIKIFVITLWFVAEEYGEAAEYFGRQMSQETGMPLQECIDRIAESPGRAETNYDPCHSR